MPTEWPALEEHRRKKAAWDSAREQRVWNRVLLTMRGAGEVPVTPARPSLFKWAALAVGVAVSAAVGFTIFHSTEPASNVVARGSAPSVSPSEAELPGRTITFSEGSRAVLDATARVGTLEDTPEIVRLVQHTGSVSYAVVPELRRSFTVLAGDVTVTVRGTRFSVSISEGSIGVDVAEGRVRVARGLMVQELGPGETLRLSSAQTPEAPEPSSTDVAVPAPTASEAPSVPSARASASTPEPEAAPETAEALLHAADQARVRGELDEAARWLQQLVANHSGDPRVVSALFTLGRVERERGRHTAAARAFSSCAARDPRGTLGADALAEEVASWVSAGAEQRAREAARRYLELHPTGRHAQRLKALAQ